jgi:hypothetical protein
MSEDVGDPGLTQLATALSALAPRPAVLDRDRLMFAAGRQSARRSRLWPCVSALLAVLSVGLGTALVLRPEPRVVYVTPPAPPPPAPAPAESREPTVAAKDDHWQEQIESLRLRNRVLRLGVEALPEAPRPQPTEKPLTIESLLQ